MAHSAITKINKYSILNLDKNLLMRYEGRNTGEMQVEKTEKKCTL